MRRCYRLQNGSEIWFRDEENSIFSDNEKCRIYAQNQHFSGLQKLSEIHPGSWTKKEQKWVEWNVFLARKIARIFDIPPWTLMLSDEEFWKIFREDYGE